MKRMKPAVLAVSAAVFIWRMGRWMFPTDQIIFTTIRQTDTAQIFFCGDENAKIQLPIAANMGAKYHDSGINIDNWYNDDPRYTPSENGHGGGSKQAAKRRIVARRFV